MENGHSRISMNVLWWMLLWSMLEFRGGFGIRFVIDKSECFTQDVKYEGDTVHISFVVVKNDGYWHYGEDGVDLVIKGPSGEQIHDFRDKSIEMYEFLAQRKGLYQFCFTSKSPYRETIDFDMHVGHFMYYDQHAKDEHFNPTLTQISKLEEALYNIQFEQHWLEAQIERQAILNEVMEQRAVYKAIFESLALVGISFLQYYACMTTCISMETKMQRYYYTKKHYKKESRNSKQPVHLPLLISFTCPTFHPFL